MSVSVLLLVALFTWRYYETSFDFFRSLGIPLLCYAIVLGGIFIFHLGRTPVVLDQEKTAEVARLSEGLQKAEESTKEKTDIKLLHKRFAVLMSEGRNLQHDPDRASVGAWKNRVTQALIDANLFSDSVLFTHANDNLSLPAGVASPAYVEEANRRKVAGHCEVLENIVHRVFGQT